MVPEDGWKIASFHLRFPTLTEALDLAADSTTTNESYQLADTLQVETDSIALPMDTIAPQPDSIVPTPTPPVPSEPTAPIDTRIYLASFYQALDSAERMPIRVVHYGDSQIEEDRITNILREQWQERYGGGGVGLIPLHQTIPTRSIRQYISMNDKVQSAQGGPKRYLVYGPRAMRLTESSEYGVMGQVARMDNTLVQGSEDIVLHIAPANKKYKPHNYFNRLRVLTDSVRVNDLESGIHDLTLADSTTQCVIHLHGRGNVYGVSLETTTGIIVDNIPMRGCSGNIFTRIDSIQLSQFYHETNTRLIILQYGGNMIPQTENRSTISGYVRNTLRQQVRYLRACAPEAAILFVGPSDMSTNIDGKMTTYPLLPYMDQLLLQMAQEEGIAYWSMYNAMGGYNSMVSWYEKGLAGSDYVHFTRAGANNIGKKLYHWIEESRYLIKDERSESHDTIHSSINNQDTTRNAPL